MNWSVSRLRTCNSLRPWIETFRTRALRMTSCPSASFISIVWTRSLTKSMRKRSDTSSSCSSTNRAGVQRKRTVMTQKVASMRTTHAISVDLQTCSSMRQKTARPCRVRKGGSTVQRASSAPSATPRSRGSTTPTSTRGSSVTVCVVTRWRSVPFITTLERRVSRTNSASST